MDLKYQKYDFTPVLGWSISRFEMFDKCKRQYFYNYYSRFVPDVPQYKMTWYKELTSVALEIGNVVHDVLEKFLKRLQVSISDIDEERFFQYARSLTEQYFSGKTFIEKYYGYCDTIDMTGVHEKSQPALITHKAPPTVDLYDRSGSVKTDDRTGGLWRDTSSGA